MKERYDIPATMQAWVLEAPKQLALKAIDTPVPGDDQVLVRVDAACICNGSDPGIYIGHEAYQTPMVFGHEAAGIIVAAGKAVHDFSVGQRVCWWCEMGAFAQYQAVTPKNIAMFEVPANVTVDQSPVLELVIAACRALMDTPPTAYGGALAVLGMGPSGLTLIQYARVLGYQKVIAWDLYADRRERALSLGADAAYDPAQLTPAALAAMGGVDVAVDMMGDDVLPGEDTFTRLLRIVRPGGLVISYGHPDSGRRFSPYVFQSRDLTMKGPVNDIARIREMGAGVMRAVAQGDIQLEPLITHRIDFAQFGSAFERLLRSPDQQIKVIMKWNR